MTLDYYNEALALTGSGGLESGVCILNPPLICFRCRFKKDDLQTSFLTALKHGARYIYVSDNILTSTLSILEKRFYGEYTSLLRYNGSSPDPLSHHFFSGGQTEKPHNATNSLYHLGVWKKSPIQKVVEPPATGIQTASVPLLLPYNSLRTVTFNNLLFHYDAFWSVALSHDNYLWSAWTQKLMTELGTSILYLSDLKSTPSKCSKIKEDPTVIQKIQQWSCTERTSFFTCVLSLTNYLIEQRILDKYEYELVEEWLEQLLRNGYEQPNLVPVEKKLISLEPPFTVLYEPTKHKYVSTFNSTYSMLCKKALPKCPNVVSKSVTKLNIVLVIVYNKAGHYKSVEYLESIYRPVFKHILYCGSDISNFLLTYNTLRRPVTFVEMDARRFANGEQGYMCLQQAIRMNYDADGYFHLGEDVLLNLWNLHDMPTDKIWFQQSLRPANLSQPTVPDVWKNPNWWPWSSSRGRVALQRAINTIVNLSSRDRLAKKFLDMLSENGQGSNRVFYEVSDIFYIPQVLAREFLYFSNVFNGNNVYLEIAIPTIIAGLVNKRDIHIINGSYLWYHERVLYKKTFSYKNIFLHSLKPGLCFPDKECLQFMCERYLPFANISK